MTFDELKQVLLDAQAVLVTKTAAESVAREALNVARDELLAATQAVSNAEKTLIDSVQPAQP